MSKRQATFEHLSTIAAAYGQGYMDADAANQALDVLIYGGVHEGDVDPAKELATQMLGIGTEQEIEARRLVRDLMGSPVTGLDLDDPLVRQRALDWLESIRDRLPPAPS